MERIVEMSPAYDKRHPDPSQDYGIHGVSLRMILKGDKGAVQFLLYTGWYLPETLADYEAQGKPLTANPLPADRGYHSPIPQYEGQALMSDECEWLDGKPCYYDGSGMAAEGLFDTLRREGSEGVWRELEEYYHSMFDNEEEANDE